MSKRTKLEVRHGFRIKIVDQLRQHFPDGKWLYSMAEKCWNNLKDGSWVDAFMVSASATDGSDGRYRVRYKLCHADGTKPDEWLDWVDDPRVYYE